MHCKKEVGLEPESSCVNVYRGRMLSGSWVLKMGYTSVLVILALCSVTDSFGRSGINEDISIANNYWI